MSIHGSIRTGDGVVMKHLPGALGILRGWASEDKQHVPGESSMFSVALDRNSITGVSELTINLNHWDVYKLDDPDLIGVLLEHFAPLERA